MINPSFLTVGDLKNKNVLVRVDFNVPIQDGVVQDISRIQNIAPTIEFLKKAEAKIILMSHLGKTPANRNTQSLRVVIDALSKEYNSDIIFIDDCLSTQAPDIIKNASYNNLILLENLRFYKEEELCDKNFARKLAGLADFYINEAFSVSHRKHASIYELPKLLPHAIGIAFAREIQIIDNFLSNAKSPKMAIVGGAKLSTKIKLLKNLVKKIDKLALGGGIAGAFLAFYGNYSLQDFDPKEYEEDIKSIISNALEYGCELILPVDFAALVNNSYGSSSSAVCHCQKKEFSQGKNCVENHKHLCDKISEDHLKQLTLDIIETTKNCEKKCSIATGNNNRTSIFDIGPASIELFKKHICESATILWNGPVGLFEKAPFDFGTMSLAKEVARLSRAGCITSIVGGGDTAFAMNKFGVSEYLTYQSTSGGAFLTYLEGGELPGLIACGDGYVLQDNEVSRISMNNNIFIEGSGMTSSVTSEIFAKYTTHNQT